MTSESETCCCHCCIYPQGLSIVFPQILSVIAFSTSTIALLADYLCFEKNYEYCYGNQYDGYNCESYSDYNCQRLRVVGDDYYDNTENSAAIMSAAVFAILSTLIGFVAMSVLFSGACFTLNRKVTSSLAVSFMVCFVFDGLTFIAFAIDKEEVGVAGGAISAIFAMVLWLLLVAAVLRVQQKQEAPAENTTGTPTPSPIVPEHDVESAHETTVTAPTQSPTIQKQDMECASPMETQ